MNTSFRVETDGHLVVVTVTNPPNNELGIVALQELRELIGELSRDRSVIALILTGKGDRFFSAGAKIDTESLADPEYVESITNAFHTAFREVQSFQGVTIAAINGAAFGGGLELVLACDIRVADPKAIMGFPEAKLGLLPCGGGTQNLSWLVGEGWAKRMILLGETLNAKRALKIGIVQELSAEGRVLELARHLALQANSQSPDSIFACKELIHEARDTVLASGLELEKLRFRDLFLGENALEGVRAHTEKRLPRWSY